MTTFTEKRVFQVEHCINCGVEFALTDQYVKARKDDHRSFYCPNGHGQHWPQENTEEKAKRLLRNEKARSARIQDTLDLTREILDAAEKSRSAFKGQATKLRYQLEKVEKGVCPYCKRSFEDLRKHMRSKHE